MAKEETLRISRLLSETISRGLITDETPSVEVFDFDYFLERIKTLETDFPEEFIVHALAVKANPIRGILQVQFNRIIIHNKTNI